MLTAAQIEAFKRDGAVALRGFFSPEEVASWRAEVFGYFGHPSNGDEWRRALTMRSADDFRLHPDPTPNAHRALARAYRALHTMACEWAGHNQLVVRAGNDPAEWRGARAAHVDIPICAPLRMFANTVIYLSAVRERGGAFMYWPGSHRVAWDYFVEFPMDYMAAGERSHNQVFERIEARTTTTPVEFLGAPGDLLIWHSLMLHSGSVNKRAEERLAIFGRWGVVVEHGERHDFLGDMWSFWQFDTQ